MVYGPLTEFLAMKQYIFRKHENKEFTKETVDFYFPIMSFFFLDRVSKNNYSVTVFFSVSASRFKLMDPCSSYFNIS